MKKLLIISLAVLAGLTLAVNAGAKEENSYSMKPTINNGKPWRIGYMEGGPYTMYPTVLRNVVIDLGNMGWLEVDQIPDFDDASDSEKLWTWLTQNANSRYIHFVSDAYWSSNWDESLRQKNREDVLTRLKNNDIDLMIAMGTWSGQDLANDQHSVDTLVFASSSPVESGIVKSVSDSGYDHVHARVDGTRFERQVRLFHDIVGFSKLGVAYEDTVAGRSYAALGDIEKVAKERGFNIRRCHTLDNIPDVAKAEQTALHCYKELAPKVDAVYLTIQGGVTLNNLPNIMEVLNEHKVYTFSQAGSEEVKHGVLFSIAQANFKYVSQFHAETIAKVLNGAQPGKLNQVFEDPPKIAINLATAEKIGYDPPVDVLGAADEIHLEILPPPKKQ